MYLKLALFFMGMACLLLFAFELPLHEISQYFTSMALLLCLLYLLPFIHHFMITSRLDRELYRFLDSNVKDGRHFYIRTSFANYILSLFIFLSALPLTYRFLTEKLQKLPAHVRTRFTSSVILRSFASSNVWSPIEVYIVIVVAITGVYYLELLPYLITLSFITLLLDWVFTSSFKSITAIEDSHQLKVAHKGKLSLLFFFLAGFISSAASIQAISEIDFFEAIILLIVPYTLLWSVCLKRRKSFVRYTRLVWYRHITTMQNFFILFLALGFFNEVVEHSGILAEVMEVAEPISTYPLLLFIGLQLSTLFLACVGVHPLATLSLQGLFVTPFLTVLEPLSVAIVLITSTVANDAAGTFNVPVTMMSQYTGVHPYSITRLNLGFALRLGGVGVIVGYLLL
ncbi:hypothetical protein [Salsuginibacillus kocurii]|uniref:hypothetical protein n=1 Tax=Salsuginibacillus kocurii TaxID=427078 RepID=UPI0012EAC65A|nr:hypothetical protein [Salsuginibacillus kocurii]